VLSFASKYSWPSSDYSLGSLVIAQASLLWTSALTQELPCVATTWTLVNSLPGLSVRVTCGPLLCFLLPVSTHGPLCDTLWDPKSDTQASLFCLLRCSHVSSPWAPLVTTRPLVSLRAPLMLLLIGPLASSGALM
jgi:hypothetical protein